MLLKTDSLLILSLRSLAPTVGIMHQKESRGFCKPRLARTFSPCWHSLNATDEVSTTIHTIYMPVRSDDIVRWTQTTRRINDRCKGSPEGGSEAHWFRRLLPV